MRVLLSGTPTMYLVDTTTDTGAGSGTVGDLRYCINQANANPNPAGSLIQFVSPTFSALSFKLISLSSTLNLTETAGPEIIEGPGVTISGRNKVGVFNVARSVTATLSGMTIQSGSNSRPGGAVYSEATLTITTCKFQGNHSATAGGAIAAAGGTLTINDSSFSQNSAPIGGAIDNRAYLTDNGSSFSGNQASVVPGGGLGGGLANDVGGTATLTNTTIGFNTAAYGGGIYNAGASSRIAIIGGNIASNSSTSGAGIFNDSGVLTVTGSIVQSNAARTGIGGGFYINGGTVAIASSTITRNSAFQGAAGIYLSRAVLTITASTISSNSSNDILAPGGGIEEDAGSMLMATNSTIADNFATGVGSGIYLKAGEFRAVNCTIAFNDAPAGSTNFGGGLNVNSGTATLNNTIVVFNSDEANVGPRPDDIFVSGSGSVSAASAHNLIGNGGNSSLLSGVNGNLVGVTDPRLDRDLADLGGPTQTIALLVGSLAVDAGSNDLAIDASGAPLTVDQRGRPRILGSTVDIGAYELKTPVSGPTPTPTPTPTGTPTPTPTLPPGPSPRPTPYPTATPTGTPTPTETGTSPPSLTASPTSTPTFPVSRNPGALVTVDGIQWQNRRLSKKHASRVLVVHFSGALAPGPAQNLAEYHLAAIGKAAKHGGHASKPVALKSAVYNPAMNTVTLSPRGTVPRQPWRLRITAPWLIDAGGQPIDGDRDGQPGGDMVATFGVFGISTSQVSSPAAMRSVGARRQRFR